ncbi:two-partner secretion domain-containing protein, partial [Elioraea sp.]|uniref:two-partner secretion domain-containing protein n=1 Tax=Elioraea sp. TaxID=2185103 RepID=UPI003F707D8C
MTPRSLLLAGAALVALVPPSLAQAPQGGIVAHGSAAISATAAETRVQQSTDRAIIDWRSFDVGRDHRVAFEQPGARSATLNRVNSGRGSTIAGQITAPGTVIIQNNHGVVFAGTARVDVGSLVATSRTVDAGRFAADGRLELRGGEAAGARVENQGSITVREAGLAALVGGRVANSGTIVARRGTVALASGDTTTIDLAGDGVVQIVVSGDAGRADAGVENTGLIDAGGGRVVLSAGTAAGLLSSAINTSGVIRAASADGAGGSIELVGRGQGTVRVAGTLDASGATRGGAVTVTGQDIRVASTARVSASGRAAGGSVRIGGDRQGTGTLRRAETTTVEAGARIEARASAGTGGSVILWADREGRFDGAISVGGLTDGGFAETSAIHLLEIGDAASVDVGPGGHWLIDPINITVDAALAATIVGTLDGGGDVTVTTEQPGAQIGNLVVNSSIVWSGAGNLTLFANNNININDNVAVTTSGAGSLEARALVDTSIAGPVTSTGTGTIRVDTGRNM